MERMKKTYSLREDTIKSISEVAELNKIPDSYALDMIVSIYMRKIKKSDKKEQTEPSEYKGDGTGIVEKLQERLGIN